MSFPSNQSLTEIPYYILFKGQMHSITCQCFVTNQLNLLIWYSYEGIPSGSSIRQPHVVGYIIAGSKTFWCLEESIKWCPFNYFIPRSFIKQIVYGAKGRCHSTNLVCPLSLIHQITPRVQDFVYKKQNKNWLLRKWNSVSSHSFFYLQFDITRH